MSKKTEIKNDWAKTIFIFIRQNNKGISMAEVLTNYDRCFYKFQNRLKEIENDFDDFNIDRVFKTYKSKLTNKTKTYMEYTCKNTLEELNNLYNTINNNGLKINKND